MWNNFVLNDPGIPNTIVGSKYSESCLIQPYRKPVPLHSGTQVAGVQVAGHDQQDSSLTQTLIAHNHLALHTTLHNAHAQ